MDTNKLSQTPSRTDEVRDIIDRMPHLAVGKQANGGIKEKTEAVAV